MIENERYYKSIKKLDNKPEYLFAWELREAVARKISLTIWGEGYLFQSNNKKINDCFKKAEFICELQNTLAYIERNCSMYGRAIITINKTESGDYMLNVADPYYFSGVGKAFIQPQLAVIWQRFVVDTKHFIVESIYDCNKVVNKLYTSQDGKEIRVFEGEAEILKKFRLQKEWIHNLGFPPVVEFVNIPNFFTKTLNEGYITLTDWFPAVQFEKTAYLAKKNLEKELAYCHSRIAVDNATQNFINKLNAATDVWDNDLVISTDTGAEVKFMPGNGDYTKYTQTLDHIFDIYFKLCGQSRFSEGGGAQKTVAETSSIRTGMIEQTNQKIKLREFQTKVLLRKLFACYGLIKDYWEFKEDEEFDFRINGNILKDEAIWVDTQMKLIQLGVKTEIDLIQDVFNIPKDEAERKFESNKDWLEQNSMGLEEFGLEEDESNEASLNKTTGEHRKDPAKRGEA